MKSFDTSVVGWKREEGEEEEEGEGGSEGVSGWVSE